MIRFATNDDIPAIMALAKTAAIDSSYAGLDFCNDKFCAFVGPLISHGFAIVAEHEGAIVGGFLGDAVYPWHSMDLIGIDYGVYIEPAHRNGLLAAKMVKQFETWCGMMKVKQIRLGISSGNNAAGRLYESLSYENVGALFIKGVL